MYFALPPSARQPAPSAKQPAGILFPLPHPARQPVSIHVLQPIPAVLTVPYVSIHLFAWPWGQPPPQGTDLIGKCHMKTGHEKSNPAGSGYQLQQPVYLDWPG